MIHQTLTILADWSVLDTWIVITAAVVAMACALPGVYLVLRRQSMMGDALSHTALPGIVLAFLAAQWLRAADWITPETYDATRQGVLLLGALLVGVLAALLTEWVQKLGHVESSAALGVVFTTLFAAGLLLLRAEADHVDLDPDCVLYGTIETAVIDLYGTTGIPRPAVLGAIVLGLNLLLMLVFYKELRISAFDPALATTLGINAQAMHYALMAVTAATVVAAFESVGSILVIAMLIVPPATASLLTRRLGVMIGLSLGIAALSAPLGHLMAITLPPLIFGPLGFPTVVDASTAGGMAVAAGMLFLLAMFFAPRRGIVSRAVDQSMLSLKIASEDLLGLLYRAEEMGVETRKQTIAETLRRTLGIGPILARAAAYKLAREGQLIAENAHYRLTPEGRDAGSRLIRSHRLWEAYLAKHMQLPPDHLHEPAERAEHFIDREVRERLSTELDQPQVDPHGRKIGGEEESS